jgi:hypothetical protein
MPTVLHGPAQIGRDGQGNVQANDLNPAGMRSCDGLQRRPHGHRRSPGVRRGRRAGPAPLVGQAAGRMPLAGLLTSRADRSRCPFVSGYVDAGIDPPSLPPGPLVVDGSP